MAGIRSFSFVNDGEDLAQDGGVVQPTGSKKTTQSAVAIVATKISHKEAQKLKISRNRF
jgi:hypothetical protein